MKKSVACILLLVPALLNAQAPASPVPPSPPPVRLGGDVALASLLARVDPEYPAFARAARIEDNVMVQVQISKEGKLATQTVVRGHPLLHDAALNAVRQWQFKPIVLSGSAVDVVTVGSVN